MEEDIDHEYTDEIVCPYCGYEFTDSQEESTGEEILGLIDCPECNEKFYAFRNISISYSTEKSIKGKCKLCGKEDTVIEDYHSTMGSYEGLCLNCGEKEREKMRDNYFKALEEDRLNLSYLQENNLNNLSKILPINNSDNSEMEVKLEELGKQIKEIRGDE